MDAGNVLTITQNVHDLERDMSNWSALPYDVRKASDKECIRRYGIDNTQLYKKLKAILLGNAAPLTQEDVEKMFISEESEFEDDNDNTVSDTDFEYSDDMSDEEYQERIWRSQMIEQLEQSPTIVIIDPYTYSYDLEAIEELDQKYQRYCYLNEKYKRISNSYSVSFFGYNVPNMYNITRSKILEGLASEDPDDIDTDYYFSNDFEDNDYNEILYQVEKMAYSGDIEGLKAIKENNENYLKDMKITEAGFYKNRIFPMIDKYKYDYIIPSVVPMLTESDMNHLHIKSRKNINYNNYGSIVKDTISKYKNGEANSQSLLELGWNPGFEFNSKSLEYAKNKQLDYLNNNAIKVIDNTRVVSENANNDNDKYVYIVANYNYTPTVVPDRVDYTKQFQNYGIAFNESLNTIYNIGINNNNKYIRPNNKNTALEVYKLDIGNSDNYEKLISIMEDYILDRNNCKSIYNLLTEKLNENVGKEAISLITSKFMKDISMLSENSIVLKDNNIYKIYEGLYKDYNI